VRQRRAAAGRRGGARGGGAATSANAPPHRNFTLRPFFFPSAAPRLRSQDVVQNKSELEKKLDEVLSKSNWGTPTSTLREIASATHYQCVPTSP
jgi:hypothetical protein